MRASYTTNDLELFRERASNYIKKETPKKSMGEFCKYMGITRKTLSKYKNRDIFWQSTIDNIKDTIKIYNEVMSLCGFDFVMECWNNNKQNGIDKAVKNFMKIINERNI